MEKAFMSDVNEKEAKWQARLEGSYMELLKLTALFVVGWFILFLAREVPIGPGSKLGMILGWCIAGDPTVLKFFTSRSLQSLFDSNYEVITTYGDGRKESDHGAESNAMSLGLMVFVALLLFLLGGIITLIRIVFFAIKAGTCYIAVKEKPPLWQTPFVLIIGFVALVFLGAIIPTKIGEVRSAAYALPEPKIVNGTVMTTTFNPTLLSAKADDDYSAVVLEIPIGETLTATGTVKNKDYIPVDFNGTVGWVYRNHVMVDMPPIATGIVTERTSLYGLASDNAHAGAPLLEGSTVSIIGAEKKGFTPVEVNALAGRKNGVDVFYKQRGFVKTDLLTIQNAN
jgi:hypothetical protein